MHKPFIDEIMIVNNEKPFLMLQLDFSGFLFTMQMFLYWFYAKNSLQKLHHK